MKDLNGIDLPEGLIVIGRVRGNIVDAALCGTPPAVHGAARFGERPASPVAAESGVENNHLLIEELSQVAGALEEGHGGAKAGRIEVAVGDGRGSCTSREEPDCNVVVCQLHGIHPATCIVERGAKGARIADNTAGIVRTRPLSTFIASQGGSHIADRDRTIATSVQGGLVVGHEVDSLDDVDFAVGRPIGPNSPKGRPNAARVARHMFQVGNKQAVVVHLFALDAHRITAWPVRVKHGGRVNTHEYAAVGLDADDASVFGGSSIEVGHKAVAGIFAGEEVKVIKEVFTLPAVN